MTTIQKEFEIFKGRREAEVAEASQRAAFQFACGVDITDINNAAPEQVLNYIGRISRLVERERLRGMRKHWSYDLNRHIALKHVLERLKAQLVRLRSWSNVRPDPSDFG